MTNAHPYRLVISATMTQTIGKGKRQRTKTVGCVYFGWTSTQHYNEARLPGAGSFLYPGLHAVRHAAFEYLAQPEVHQVQVRTNQDRIVYLYNKHADGRVTGYGKGCDL